MEKKVIAHFMHEHELAEARTLLHDTEETESFVLGSIDDSEIPELEQRGLIVQVLADEPQEETGGRVRGAIDAEPEMVPFGGEAPRPAGLYPPEPNVQIDEVEANFYLLRLEGPLLAPWREELDRLGVTLLERVPPASFTARLEPGQAREVAELPFVSGLRPYKVEDSGPVALAVEPLPSREAPGPTRALAMQAFDVRLHRKEDERSVETWLHERNVEVAGAGRRKIRIYAIEEAPVLEEIEGLPAVERVEPYVEPKLFNEVARVLLGVDRPGGGNPGPIGLEGEGEVVAVADTGLDDTHPDFAGRIQQVVALGRPNDASDPNGHGTHVAGSVLGDGTASNGTVRGVAPRAALIFQSLLDSRGRLELPVNLGDLFDSAYQAGARIHNNSWGAATESRYTLNSEDVDDFVAEHRDMLIVIAAGNEAQAATRIHTLPGFPDWLSIGSPATSKNALTVGASRSSRNSGGIANQTWGHAWPSSFPDPPIAAETVSGDPESLAGFSSRGPSDDRRIKPDVVAPGTDIASTKSAIAPLRAFWGPYPGASGRYAYMGGTSMATPLVSGCAALVREYYVKQRQHHPSAALLKATLINGARWLTGRDAVADQGAAPNYYQGFGAINLPWTIPNEAEPGLKLEFVDSCEDRHLQFGQSGQRFRFKVAVTGGQRLRFCLAYTDAPGRSLQNDVNVTVQEPSGNKRVGNEHLPERLTPLDRGNNVEIVRIDDPAPGEYLVNVSAGNILRPGQDFALVVTGELGSGLVPA